MSLYPLQITIQLDGSGVYYDRREPLHLDSLLAAMLCRWHTSGEPPTRDEEPTDISLPLDRWCLNGAWGWKASALFPEGETAETLAYWRKRFREHRADTISPDASPNLTNATYRAWNMPLPLLLCHSLVGWCIGDRRAVRRALKDLRYIGKKRAHGHGRVIGVDVERNDDDYSMWRDGCAQRWLPAMDGSRLVRPRPPYWSMIGRVQCHEVGDHCSPR